MSDSLPRVLFVDDESSILDALQRLVEQEDWDCYYAKSADEALAMLEKQRFDLIVSDVIMPEKNGFALLNEVRKHYPWTVRIFLTAFARQETVVQALADGCVQQIIGKPWNDQELKEVIRSALRQYQQQKNRSIEFQAVINSIPLLPALPQSYTQVRSCISADDVDIDRMAELISQDVGLSSALLRWANSAIFGLRFQVETVKRAIVVLGTDIVESLVLSEAISQAISENLPNVSGFPLNDFQRHSFATAAISRQLIGNLFSSDKEKQDRAFIAGLLHDLGKLAAASFFSQKFAKAISLAKSSACSLSKAEKKILGVTHAELGSFLAEWWALPPLIVNAIHWHHDPAGSPVERDLMDAVHVANLLSHQFGFGSNGDTKPEEATEASWERFFLTEEGIEILKAKTEELVQTMSS